MMLKEYIALLKPLVKLHGNKTVFYSCDEEGNDFKPVYYSPSIMNLSDFDDEVVVVIN